MLVAEPIQKGHLVMRGDDPRCKGLLESVNEGKKWRTVQECLEWTYLRRLHMRSPRPFVLEGMAGAEGGEGDGIMALSILREVHKTLGFDYLIYTVESLYGDDPEALFNLTQSLARWCRISEGRAFNVIDAYQLRKQLSERPSKAEKTLDGWNEFSVKSLKPKFMERGWLE